MPFITIDTNAEVEVTPDMLNEFGAMAAEVLGKPRDYVTVKINAGKSMMFGPSMGNIGALIEFKSIGYGDKKPILAEKIKEFAITRFGAQGLYVGIHFVDMPANNVSHDGKLMG